MLRYVQKYAEIWPLEAEKLTRFWVGGGILTALSAQLKVDLCYDLVYQSINHLNNYNYRLGHILQHYIQTVP